MQIDEEEISCGDKASCKRKEGVRGCYCDRGYDGDPYVGCEGISKKKSTPGVTFSFAPYSTTLHLQM